jgi:hypothetical protein
MASAAFTFHELPSIPGLLRQEAWAGDLPIGTFCSGTDAAIFVYQAFSSAVKSVFDVQINIVHKFGCESDVKKRAFILDLWSDVQLLFADVCAMGQDTSLDTKSNVAQAVPNVKVAVGGFSCKDASSLNPRAHSLANRMAIAEAGLCRVASVLCNC